MWAFFYPMLETGHEDVMLLIGSLKRQTILEDKIIYGEIKNHNVLFAGACSGLFGMKPTGPTK